MRYLYFKRSSVAIIFRFLDMEDSVRKYLLTILVFSAVSFAETANQTDWSGGGGVPGPVTDWGSSYFASSLVSTTITGVLRLASGVLPTPTEHTVGDNFNGAASVYAIDIDDDGNTDVLVATRSDDGITPGGM